MPQSSSDPEGIKTEYVYDLLVKNLLQSTRNAKPGSSEADIVTSATYNTSNPKFAKKPQTATDAKGNVTTYTYAAQHGGILTKTAPAVNGVQPQTRYEYAQRRAWYKNAAGSYVQSPTAMWLLTKEEYCKTTAASGSGCAGGTNDEVVTQYDYGPNSGPNTLLLRGITVTATNAAGQLETLRSCYTYDDFGRRISETQPKGTGSTCP